VSTNVTAVYLRDHAAVSAGGIELVGRVVSGRAGTPFGEYARLLQTELASQDAALRAVLRAFDVRPSAAKLTAARLGERAGRLKLNGRLRQPSPLSPVVEAEGLLAIVGSYLLVWEGLAAQSTIELDPGVDLGALAAAARRALDELQSHQQQLLAAVLSA
jgi:hypothetical protein